MGPPPLFYLFYGLGGLITSGALVVIGALAMVLLLLEVVDSFQKRDR